MDVASRSGVASAGRAVSPIVGDTSSEAGELRTKTSFSRRFAKDARKKSLAHFYAAQNDCKTCSPHWKNVSLLVKRQGQEAWFMLLSESEQNDVVKSYSKAREKADKERTKLAFTVRKYKEELKAQEGTRLQAVQIHLDLLDYHDLSKSKTLEQEQKLSNKMSEDQLKDKTNQLLLSGEGSSSSFRLDAAAVAGDLAGVALERVEDGEGMSGLFTRKLRVPDVKQLSKQRRQSFGSS